MIVGDFGLSDDQEKTQFAMWAMFAAPLLMSNDLRNIKSTSRELLLNKRIIAVNQDKLGVQGTLLLEVSTHFNNIGNAESQQEFKKKWT